MPDESRPSCSFDPEQLQLRYEARIPAEVKAIEPAVEAAMGIVRDMGCAKGKEFEVETSLREAIANAIVHGARGQSGESVELLIACEPSQGMLVIVRDPGPGFDPATVASPLLAQNIYASHGRGIYMINQLMDEVTFERGGTEIRMIKR